MAKQLDADLKKLLTKREAQEALNAMQMSAENFEKQAGSLNERYSSNCKALTENTKLSLTAILNDTKKQLSDKCAHYGVKLLIISAGRDALASAIGKKTSFVSAAAVTDGSFAEQISFLANS